MRLGGHIVEECERKHALSEQYAANLNPQHLVSRLCCHSALQEIQPCMIIFQSSFNLKLPGKLLQGLTRSDFYDFNGGSSGCCGRRGSRCGCGAGQCFPINDIGVVVGKLGAGGAQVVGKQVDATYASSLDNGLLESSQEYGMIWNNNNNKTKQQQQQQQQPQQQQQHQQPQQQQQRQQQQHGVLNNDE